MRQNSIFRSSEVKNSHVKMSPRLLAISSLVEKDSKIADIGTDHGYVPIFLVREKIVSKAIMSDVSQASLEKGKANAEEILTAKEFESLEFRVSDGIEKLVIGEVDTLIFAGMGAELMVKIITADIEKSNSFETFIMQPRTKDGFLRFALERLGFNIVEEVFVEENSQIWGIIKAENMAKSHNIIDFETLQREYQALTPKEKASYQYPSYLAKQELDKASHLNVDLEDFGIAGLTDDYRKPIMTKGLYVEYIQAGEKRLRSILNGMKDSKDRNKVEELKTTLDHVKRLLER